MAAIGTIVHIHIDGRVHQFRDQEPVNGLA